MRARVVQRVVVPNYTRFDDLTRNACARAKTVPAKAKTHGRVCNGTWIVRGGLYSNGSFRAETIFFFGYRFAFAFDCIKLSASSARSARTYYYSYSYVSCTRSCRIPMPGVLVVRVWTRVQRFKKKKILDPSTPSVHPQTAEILRIWI